MVRKFRRKPLILEVVQFDGTNHDEVRAFCGSDKVSVVADTFEILTLEGVMRGRVGDYIVRGIAGEFHAVQKEIFEKTYEPE